MALSESIKTLSGVAGAALTVYRFVQLQTDGKYDPCGDGGRIDGIAAESVAADLDAFPRVAPDSSEAKVEAGATVSVGDLVDSDATARAITHVSGVGRHRAGIALTGGAVGEVITIQFKTELDEVA